MKSAFAIFDVDDTIISGDSMFLSIFFTVKKKPWIIVYIPIILIKVMLYFLRIIDKKTVKEYFYFPLMFLGEKELEEFYDNVLSNKINTDVMKSLQQHKDNGCHILLVSASPEIYLRYFKKNNSIDGVIGTMLQDSNGKYTNKIKGENCKGIEKVKRINQYLEENSLEIDFENSFAYSDSLADIPMLSLVNNRYKVNKNQEKIGEFIW